MSDTLAEFDIKDGQEESFFVDLSLTLTELCSKYEWRVYDPMLRRIDVDALSCQAIANAISNNCNGLKVNHSVAFDGYLGGRDSLDGYLRVTLDRMINHSEGPKPKFFVHAGSRIIDRAQNATELGTRLTTLKIMTGAGNGQQAPLPQLLECRQHNELANASAVNLHSLFLSDIRQIIGYLLAFIGDVSTADGVGEFVWSQDDMAFAHSIGDSYSYSMTVSNKYLQPIWEAAHAATIGCDPSEIENTLQLMEIDEMQSWYANRASLFKELVVVRNQGAFYSATSSPGGFAPFFTDLIRSIR